MKNQKGITLVSLVLYVIIMTIVLGVMSVILDSFYNNTEAVQGNVQEIVEFNKFNNYFLKEVKKHNNKVDSISNEYILFKSGNSFSLLNDAVYYNSIKICDNVQRLQFTLVKDNEDEEDEYSIISVTLLFAHFSKTMNYKIENIY